MPASLQKGRWEVSPNPEAAFRRFLGPTSILAPEPVNDRRELMKNRMIKVVAGVTAVAAFALGGAAIAQAVGNSNSGDNNGSASNSSGALPQRSDETVLTGDTASKVTAAAQAKVPGATIERVETDADGHAAYEAHMIRADGSRVTVYVNKQFEVVGTDSGPPSR
jgi:uncharacterized membrane protein YkoI